MTDIDKKREQIRDEVYEILMDLPKYDTYGNVLRRILKCLDDRGVVIKVDRELPKVILGKLMSVSDKKYKSLVWEYAQGAMTKAGYEATEPLIGE